MAIIISPGYRQTAEREFLHGHPDALSSTLAARIVLDLAASCDELRRQGNGTALEQFRADLGIYALSDANLKLPDPPAGMEIILSTIASPPVEFTLGGHAILPEGISLEQTVWHALDDILQEASYGSLGGPMIPISLHTNIAGQSPKLNGITHQNLFSDACRVVGHHLAEGFGHQGTFPSLIVAQDIERRIYELVMDQPNILHTDGKVHVTGVYTKHGFDVTDVVISLAHAPGAFSEEARQSIIDTLRRTQIPDHGPAGHRYDLVPARVSINAGGDFSSYFLKADHGMSKAKDHVHITGGLTEIGTDAVWGKCLYKSSSVLLPYAFALAQVVAKKTQARFVTVSATSEHGQPRCYLQVEEIDPELEKARGTINAALQRLPRDRDAIRQATGMPVTLETYRLFNDIAGFHSPDKPWKTVPPALYTAFDEAYRRR